MNNTEQRKVTTAEIANLTMGEVKLKYPSFYARCRELFMKKFPNSVIDSLTTYSDFEQMLRNPSTQQTLNNNVVTLKNQDKQALESKMAEQFDEETAKNIAQELSTSLEKNEQHGVNNLILDNRIQDIKSLEIIDYHDGKIKQICSQLSSALSDLDAHMEVCTARKTELQRLLTAYEAFLKTTSPKKTTRKVVEKTNKPVKRKAPKKDDEETTSVLGRLSK